MDLDQIAADAEDLRDRVEDGTAGWADLTDEPMTRDAALDMADAVAQQARDDARAGESR